MISYKRKLTGDLNGPVCNLDLNGDFIGQSTLRNLILANVGGVPLIKHGRKRKQRIFQSK